MFKAGRVPLIVTLWLVCVALSQGEELITDDWQVTLQEARGQTVYFHGWGGSTEANRYLRWAAQEIQQQYGVRLQHVRLGDVSESVALVRQEMVNNQARSAVDLIWVNGKNFHALKDVGALLGELSARVPNAALLDPEQPFTEDFGVPTDDYELPWGMAQFHLWIKNEELQEDGAVTPRSLLEYAQRNPGRITYPKPPEFHGTTFLKQLLLALSGDDPRLQAPITDEARSELFELLFTYLDTLHPYAWRQGQAFPNSAAEQQRLMLDGRLSMAPNFNPAALTGLQARGQVSNHVRQTSFGATAITNHHFLAIPKASVNQAGALVVLNFLLSEDAQRQKADPQIWGDPPVIKFSESKDVVGMPFPPAPEPHVTWHDALESAWRARYE
ncbi:ABC transporter substrate-binding protein [Aliidiomarina sanyensis]|nr:ABC transporter substrate-binding protein [Aliidiomarina sanyensis]